VIARRRGRPLTCRETAALLTERLEGVLPAGRLEQVEAHLAACDGCTVYAAQLEQVVAALGALGADEAEPDDLDVLLEAFRDRAVSG